jgi:hypothetical protein
VIPQIRWGQMPGISPCSKSLCGDHALTLSIRELLAALPLAHHAATLVQEYVGANEWGLAFEHIVYEISENKIIITPDVYDKIHVLAVLMKLPEETYAFLNALIK